MDTNSEELKKRILDNLKKHPEGLTIQDLSTLIKAHRQTVTKYVLVLEARELVYRRRIGAVTLHYLKENWERLRR